MLIHFLIFLTLFNEINAIIASSINILSSIEEDYAFSCVTSIIKHTLKSGFFTATYTKNLTISASKIETKIVQWINEQSLWSLEIIGQKSTINNARFVTVPQNRPVINKNNRYELSKYYIVVTDSIFNFRDKTEQLINSKSYNSKAKFIIYISYLGDDYQEIAEKMLKHLWKYQIINAILIIPSNNYFIHSIFTLYPTKSNRECMKHSEIIKIDNCKYGKTLNNSLLFANKLKLNKTRNCSIDICVIESPPFVISVKNNSGFELKLLRIIEEKLNISFRYKVKKKTEYYMYRNNESYWEGAQKFMKEHYAIGIGNMNANGEIYEDFDITIAYFFENLRWITPRANQAPKWKCLIIITGGLTVKWINDIKHIINLKIKEPPVRDSDDDVNLTIAHLQGAFVMLLFGNILAFILFLLEIIIDRLLKNTHWQQMFQKIERKKIINQK